MGGGTPLPHRRNVAGSPLRFSLVMASVFSVSLDVGMCIGIEP